MGNPLINLDGRVPEITATQRYSLNQASREEERFQRLAQEMVELHEEWAEVDAVQNSASQVYAKPRVGKRIVAE